jgi:ABC-type uncharacterized transport system involved in gliding motility auxiliary subunit
VFSILLAAALVVMVNWLARKYPQRYDFVQTSDLYKISDKTRQVLDQLDQDVTFYVFSNPQDSELYSKLDRLLQVYDAASPHVSYLMVDEIRDIDKVRSLVRELDVSEPDTVVVKMGDKTRVLKEMDMADFNFRLNEYTGGQIKELRQLKAEQAFTSALLELLNPREYIACFTVKHGEHNIFGYRDDGMSEARRYLERDNIVAQPLELVGMSDITATNIDVLVIAGPTRPFLQPEVNLVRRYLNQGGRALIMLDPEIETGLEPLLEEYNLVVGNDIVVDPARQLPSGSPLQLIVGLYQNHPVTKALRTFTLFFLARSVTVKDPANDVNKAVGLALTSRDGWGETDTDTESFKFDRGKDLAGEVSIAAAVDNERSGMRIVAVGDSDFATNREISGGANRDFFLNSVNWLIDREYLVSIGPKTVAEMKRLQLNRVQLSLITLIVIVFVPVCAVGAGIAVYLVRRQ